MRERLHREVFGQGEVVRLAKTAGLAAGGIGRKNFPQLFYFFIIFRIVSALHPLAMPILAI